MAHIMVQINICFFIKTPYVSLELVIYSVCEKNKNMWCIEVVKKMY